VNSNRIPRSPGLPGDKYELGRPACLTALEQAAAGPAEQALGAPIQMYPLSEALGHERRLRRRKGGAGALMAPDKAG
jgi:hypothetical protein